MYCKNLLKRQRQTKTVLFCKNKQRYINTLETCKSCSDFILTLNKPIKNRSNKQNKLERKRFSILTDNLKKCYYCGTENENLDLHEVYGGSNRKRSIIMGLVVPLCRKCHCNEKLINHLRIVTQHEFEKSHSREEFIELIGKSYIKGDDK